MTPSPAVLRDPENAAPARADERLTRLAERLAADSRLHHVTFAVASPDGGRRWSATAGPEAHGAPPAPGDVAPTTPPPSSRPFFIASVTKRFVVTLLLQAHERGEVVLDEPVTAYLPAQATAGLHLWRGEDRTAEVTLRHLATHTSGLPDHFEKRSGGPSLYERLAAGDDTSWGFEDMVRVTREEQRPHFAPQDLAATRQKARYSDTGFQLLIRVLEDATGHDFAALLTERITGPLGLTRTWHPRQGPTGPQAPVPTGLHAGREPVDLPGMIASSNDLVSTTEDLLAFQRALLSGELFQDAATADLLTERRNRLRNIPILHYGMGTMTFRTVLPLRGRPRRITLVGHSGATGTWLFACPELSVHLAGSVDQVKGQALPFRIMARCLSAVAG